MTNLKAKESSEKMPDATQVNQEGFDACKKHLNLVHPTALARLGPKKGWLPTRKGIEDVTSCQQLRITSCRGLPSQTRGHQG